MRNLDETTFWMWLTVLGSAVEDSKDEELKADWQEYIDTLPKEK